MIRFGVVGTGWRTRFFVRVAEARPDLFQVAGVVTRDMERAKQWMLPYDVPLYASLDTLLAQKPLFVLTSLPWHVNPAVLHELAEKDVPALSETPPAGSVAEMEALFQTVQQGAKIAVAEQYHLQPHHAARIAFVHNGKLGNITQAQVSAAHGYHGISLIRHLLGVTYENATITAKRFVSPIVRGPDRSGLPESEEITESEQIIAWLDFGEKLGVLDFTTDQYRSFIRKQRILVRGERGELINDRVIYLQNYRTPVQLDFLRHNAGEQGSQDGVFLKGIQIGEEWIYRNPLAPASLHDEDIAVGQCLLKMADYANGAEAFYSLAEACQDRYLHIMVEKALDSGQPVTTTPQIWAT